MATATPSARRWPRRRRSSTPGCSSWTRNHPQPAAVLLRARRGGSLPWCGELTFRTPTRYRAPNQEPGRILIPGDGAAGDQGLRIGLPAGRWRYANACGLSASTTSWRYGLRRTCRLVTGRSHPPRSTRLNRARLAFLAVTHRYKRTNCLWLEPFQIADSACLRAPEG